MQQLSAFFVHVRPVRWLWSTALIMALLTNTIVHAQTPTQPQANLFDAGPMPIPPFAPGIVLVGMRDDTAMAAGVLEAMQARVVESLDLRGLDGGQGTGGVSGAKLQVPPGQEWVVIEQLQQQPAVVFAEPDWIVRAAEAPIATQATGAQIALPEAPYAVGDSLYTEQWYLQRIGMSRGWAIAQQAGVGTRDPIRVSILDTGVDYNHPDLEGRLLQGRNYITPLPGNTPAVDDNGHGTHVTGLIGALVNNNGDGMAGAALAVMLEPVKVLGANYGGTVSTLAQAIRDISGTDIPGTSAKIINLSLELASNVDSTQINVLRSAIDYAVGQGALVIAAAGNCTTSGCPVRYPAAFANVLAVGATTYDDIPAYYTPTGSEIDLAAPGGASGASILSTWARQVVDKCKVGRREVDGGYYCPADGTSMAAALTTGVAALVWSMNPELSADQVRDILVESAAPLNALANQVGAGRLDAAAAARQALPARLLVSQNRLTAHVFVDDAPHTLPLTLENPSLEAMTWALAAPVGTSWLTIGGASTGSVRYGEPAQTQVTINPSALTPGLYTANLMLTGTRRDGFQTQQIVTVDVNAKIAAPPRGYLPLVTTQTTAPSTWLEPGPEKPTVYKLIGDANEEIELPFALQLHGRTIDEARIFADGFISFSALPGVKNLPNRCLANLIEPAGGVYGWWADLEPGTAGSQVSSFRPDADTFVVEYANVPSAAGVSPAYVVSFQIVLHRDGRIDLNYGALPDAQMPAPRATVGVRVQDGRFYNQVACHTGTTVLGSLPQSYDSIHLEPRDLY